MKRTGKGFRAAAVCLLLCMVIGSGVLLSGCIEQGETGAQGETEMETELEKRKDMTLAGVIYTNQNGMVYGADLSLHIEREGIVSAWYFSQEDGVGEYVSVEDLPIAPEQWAAIEEAVMELAPQLKEKQDREPGFFARLFMKAMPQPTDGPNESHFYLLWQNGSGETEQVQYEIPSGESFLSLLNVMEETLRGKTEEPGES